MTIIAPGLSKPFPEHLHDLAKFLVSVSSFTNLAHQITICRTSIVVSRLLDLLLDFSSREGYLAAKEFGMRK